MPQGDKSAYTDKQKRQAAHIEESYRKRGVSENEAEERAWRTVNKNSGGAKKRTVARKRRAKTARHSAKNPTTARKRSGARKRSSARR